MIPTLLLTIALQTAVAGDYFPLKTGTVFTYAQKGTAVQMTEVVGTSLDMGGVPVTPIMVRQIGGGTSTTYYRVDSDQILVVAYDVKHPLPVAMPLLKVGTGKIVWDFAGSTQTGPLGERLLARGEVRAAGQREVLGKKVDVIEVKLLTQKGVGMSAETYEQKAIYGRGVGLVEWTNKVTLGNNKKKADQSSYQLVDIQEAKPAG